MRRIYEKIVEEHLKKERQMVFLVGPRQVGKTTTSLRVSKEIPKHFYISWDIQKDQQIIRKGADDVADSLNLHSFSNTLPIVVFDELHKYRKWKPFIKGFFDKYSSKVQIIVTGSARLDVYKAGGDSLMGRYFLYRLHPLSVAEIVNPNPRITEINPTAVEISNEDFQALFNYGGFPEPYTRRDKSFSTRWKKLRFHQLFKEDIRELTKIQESGEIELLATLLQAQATSLTNYTNLANKVNVSVDTIKRWVKVLQSFYYCFTLQPWTKNITRSLLKEPKIYLWDWSLIDDLGARAENFIASQLLKAVDYWNDLGLGDYGLHYLRDKEKREVDFLVSKNDKPWFIVEVKNSDNAGISKSLYYYQKLTGAPHAFQVVIDMDYEPGDCFSSTEPIIVSAKTFLSQLI
ncbi:MAG: AAA family ATPase [Chlamydiales bacterium]|nr:AAA family ATPase [Chlamydiales bacterium]